MDYDFIELGRTFDETTHEQASKEPRYDFGESNEFGLWRDESLLHWSEVLTMQRVVLLSSAGSGKTEELKYAAMKLRQKGDMAFFLRIEDLPDGVKGAFEETEELGTYKEFKSWLEAENTKAWIMLDSVDESRLQDPKDFEKALKQLGKKIKHKLLDVNIVISSRPPAWRGESDLKLCKRYLGISPSLSEESSQKEKSLGGYQFIRLKDLNKDQIKRYLEKREVEEIQDFLEEVERNDAFKLISRPQDLEEFSAYWKEYGRLGNRHDLVEYRVEQRCSERNANVSEQNGITFNQVESVMRDLAMLCSLGRNASIQLPNSELAGDAMDVDRLFAEYDDRQKKYILGLPVFSAGRYGTVRFHHRSTREFLAAEWINRRLVEGVSRKKIEALFFQERYGIELIVPSMKPILSWVMLKDDRIRRKAEALDPEIIINCPAPELLPLEERARVVREVCERIRGNKLSRGLYDNRCLERFSEPALHDDLRELLSQNKGYHEVEEFLLSLILHGKIVQMMSEVMIFALDSEMTTECRGEAIKITKKLGTAIDFSNIKKQLASEETLERGVVRDLVSCLEGEDVSLLFNLMGRMRSNSTPNQMDFFSYGIRDYAQSLDDSAKWVFITQGVVYLSTEPQINKEGSHKIWLLEICLELLIDFIRSKDSRSLEPSALYLLRCVEVCSIHFSYKAENTMAELKPSVIQFPELRNALFWYDVMQKRNSLELERQGRLVVYYNVISYGELWEFTEEDIDYLIDQLETQEELDNQFIALSLLFSFISKDDQRVSKMQKILEGRDSELSDKLKIFLNPPAPIERDKSFEIKESEWKAKRAIKKKEEEKNHAEWLAYIAQNIFALKDEKIIKNCFRKGSVLEMQLYIVNETFDNSISKWSEVGFSRVEEKFGKEAAQALEEGFILSWRFYKAELASESKSTTIPYAQTFGLIGLSREIKRDPSTIEKFSPTEADLAFRYCLNELNGLPSYFLKLFEFHRDVCLLVLEQEFKWALIKNEKTHSVIGKFVYCDRNIWEQISALLLKVLTEIDAEISEYNSLLQIIHHDENISNEAIAGLSSKKCFSVNIKNKACWYASWVGVDPSRAVPALESYLVSVDSRKAESETIAFLTCLFGERGDQHYLREGFISPETLKRLIVIAFKYVKPEDDIDRSGGGIYSPQLRDDAQYARSKLLDKLKDIPGRATYESLMELENTELKVTHGAWVSKMAIERAHLDSESTAWTADQYVKFKEHYEFTPPSNATLFYHVIDKIEDLRSDLEEGDESIADLLIDKDEEITRNTIGGLLRSRSRNCYHIPQEEELADEKRIDLRVHGVGFDSPIPIEMKIADNWRWSKLVERLENQLIGDYLRDSRSNRGIYLLFYKGGKRWRDPSVRGILTFSDLIERLQEHFRSNAARFTNVEEIKVMGIDLTKRSG